MPEHENRTSLALGAALRTLLRQRPLDQIRVRELTELTARVIGYEGRILWDASRPDGTPRKLLDVRKLAGLGWRYKTELEDGIRLAYEDFLNNPMRAER